MNEQNYFERKKDDSFKINMIPSYFESCDFNAKKNDSCMHRYNHLYHSYALRSLIMEITIT